jgi:hypothetical protein
MSWLPLAACLVEIPWFLVLAVARVRVQGSSTLPIVRLLDVLAPLPVLIGMAVGLRMLLSGAAAGGRPRALWAGTIGCGVLVAIFALVLLS